MFETILDYVRLVYLEIAPIIILLYAYNYAFLHVFVLEQFL